MVRVQIFKPGNAVGQQNDLDNPKMHGIKTRKKNSAKHQQIQHHRYGLCYWSP